MSYDVASGAAMRAMRCWKLEMSSDQLILFDHSNQGDKVYSSGSNNALHLLVHEVTQRKHSLSCNIPSHRNEA
jgi:hypothetical protein